MDTSALETWMDTRHSQTNATWIWICLYFVIVLGCYLSLMSPVILLLLHLSVFFSSLSDNNERHFFKRALASKPA